MKVKQLRLSEGCYALKMADNIMAGKGTEIERFTNGDYLVRMEGLDPIVVPAHIVKFAKCEMETTPAREYATGKVPVSELKK